MNTACGKKPKLPNLHIAINILGGHN